MSNPLRSNPFQALHSWRVCAECARRLALGGPNELCDGCKWNKAVVERLQATIEIQQIKVEYCWIICNPIF